MHDVGMAFIPHSIFNKEGILSKEEIRKIQEHVVTGSQILLRFGDWNDAARMILDHHENLTDQAIRMAYPVQRSTSAHVCWQLSMLFVQ